MAPSVSPVYGYHGTPSATIDESELKRGHGGCRGQAAFTVGKPVS